MTHSSSLFSSMKFRLWRRRMSVASPRVTIKAQQPWPVRLVLGAAVLGFAAAVAMWTYDLGHGLTEPAAENSKEQLAQYKEDLAKLKGERDRLAARVDAAQSQINIERATQQQLVVQVKNLESENNSLKEDLAFFDSLLPNTIGPQGVAIRRMKIDLPHPGQLHYRLLIVQGGKGDHTFVGNLQFVVSTLQGGKSVMMNLPVAAEAGQEKFRLSFRYYQRVEGTLALPQGATVKMVQTRVLENGQIRAQQSASF